MDPYFDPTISTEVINGRNIRILIALVAFWILGAIIPLIFWPRSYAALIKLEHRKFPEKYKYKFDRHLFSNEVYAYIEKFAKFHRHKTRFYTLQPPTYEGRHIKVLHLKQPNYHENRPKKGRILVTGGMWASLWDSVSATIDIMHKLLEDCRYKVPFMVNPTEMENIYQSSTKKLLQKQVGDPSANKPRPLESDTESHRNKQNPTAMENIYHSSTKKEYDWYIIPIVNPDGYDYSLGIRDFDLLKASSPKNRNPNRYPDNTQHCYGVYLDRNFAFHWGESKPEDYNHYCWIAYAGPKPFSENETFAIYSFMNNLKLKNEQITMYLQLHGSESRDDITYPWRFTKQSTFNKPVLSAMAKAASTEVYELTGIQFTHIQGGKRDLGSGVLVDWLMGIMQVIYNFSIEPTFEANLNSTDVPNQHIYMQKVITILFALVKQLRVATSSANCLILYQSNFLFVCLPFSIIYCS